MSASDWLALTLACAAGAVSPGPSLALVLRHAVISLRQGVLCAVAHALGVGVYAGLAVSGLALLLQSGGLAVLVSVFGIGWLCWLAWQFWHGASDWQQTEGHTGPALRDGLLMGLVNPKVALFFLAIFSAVLPASASTGEQAAAVALAILIDGAWYVLASVLIQGRGTLAWLRQRSRLINRLSALIFVGLAIGLMGGLLT